MKAIISSTYDDLYIWNIPLVTWAWNRLGVNVICFMPDHTNIAGANPDKLTMILHTCMAQGLNPQIKFFKCPEHKESTYAQCSRLYGACLDLPRDEILIIGDVDMVNFRIPPHENNITIWGSDLVPDGQFPMCYAVGSIPEWRSALKLSYGTLSMEEDGIMQYHVKTYQQCLDELLGDIECEHMRGNYWGKDQQTLWENTKDFAIKIPRARPGTQFAANRVDRDDINWRAYVNDDLVDAHLWRPGFTDENFANILELMQMKYPQEDFTWLVNYNNEYKKLL